ncbi:unknown protein [Seminavis robusta]|uniref:Uncharacterized protein n=1 Tax=Seminavis robusta TaxID=568900 RepID=A0A9N8HU06_9STRA|nr:unknown protein [Seminavis robusta]|eukprot:Sro1974_g308730.1 n/a (1242) ;mRNA; r:7020-10745
MASVRFEDGGDGGGDDEASPEVEPFGVVDRGMALEDFEREEAQGFDGPNVWKAVDNVDETKATIGVAQDAAWNQARVEMQFIRQKMERLCGSQRPKFAAIFNLLFGPESEVYRCFKEEKIFDCHDDFLHFVLTFFLSSSYQVSTKQLFDKYSRINLEGALSKEEYSVYWKKIGTASLPSLQERNRSLTPTGMVPFWMKLEGSINNYGREIFIEGFPGPVMQVTLDDDKPHAHGNTYTAGLKSMRHVKDNVPGHTLHTLVLSYSQVPVQIAWEREVNDSSETATERIFSQGITPMAAQGGGDLRPISCAKDRGYWTHSILHQYFMKAGAKIRAGTVKRQPCIPMTYRQNITGKDTRVDVPVTGARTLQIMETTSHGRKLYCQAFRNGTGGVTLGISTEHGALPEWELVLAKPQDLVWYDDPGLSEDDRLKKSFLQLRTTFDNGTKTLYEDLAADLLSELHDLPVRALTTTQGSPEWFMLRKFSLTSSTTDRAIAACVGDEDWLEHSASWMTIKGMLEGLVVDVDEPRGKDNADDDAANDGDASVQSGALSDDTSQQEAEEQAEGNGDNSVKLSLAGLLDSEGLIQTAKHQIQFDEIDMAQVRAILKELGKNPSAAKDEAKKNKTDLKSFNIFLDAEPRLRRHVFKTKKHLSAIATKLGIADDGANQETIRKAIDSHLRSHPEAVIEVTLSKQQQKKEQIALLSDKNKLLLTVVKAGYLDPLKGDAKKHTRRGHQLECHIMRACLRELDEEGMDSPMKLIAACTAPLVERKQQRYVRGSIDFLAFASVDDIDVVPIGVEIKSRVAARTDQQATHQAEVIRRLLGEDRTPRQRQRKYFSVRADSDKFKRIVNSTHEAIQVLHHAFVYDLEYVLLLVGDNGGAVVYGVFVLVSDAIKEAYGDVLEDVYSSCLRWMYDDNTAGPSDDELQTVLDNVEVNKSSLDGHSFKMELALWKDINNNMTLPIPRLRHIIPLIFSYWNTLKGGSDATTNLIWHCQYSVPNNENQSVATARMLSLVGVHVHRMYQIATAREDLNRYSCLKRFRDSATERASFKKTQFLIIDHITKHFAPEETAAPVTPPRATAAAAGRGTRSQANVERTEVALIVTNKTPKRGVLAKYSSLEEKLVSGRLDKASQFVLERSKGHAGIPVKRIGDNGDLNGKGSRGSCIVCGAQTHCFCLHCKQFMCDTQSERALKLAAWKPHVIINGDSDKPIHIQRTCFYHYHKQGQEMALGDLAKRAANLNL